MKALVTLVLLMPLVAFANNTPSKWVPPVKQTVTVTNEQEQEQTQSQVAASAAQASIVEAQSAPSLGQGSLTIFDCGAAGNAGMSNTHGAGFLGFAYTPAECYRMRLAGSYFAIGEYPTGCAILAATDTGKWATKQGIPLPASCGGKPVPVPAPPVVVNVAAAPCADTSDFVRKSAMNEAIADEQERNERIVHACASK